MYELARRGYKVQLTDSRFPAEDLLVVSPKGKHFGIDVKGQSTKNFWRMKEPPANDELFFALVFVSQTKAPSVYLLTSRKARKLWRAYKKASLAAGGPEDNIWGMNWTTPHPFLDHWHILPS
jgi:hypothetical protein